MFHDCKLLVLCKQTFWTASILPGSLSDKYHDLLGIINDCTVNYIVIDCIDSLGAGFTKRDKLCMVNIIDTQFND